ncbi:MAG: hypothetical protein A2234_05655 [Elusimicrobia bacterium RIFOXYA2_FULL_58_8]|nr:MAG: hypothetical protein A2285_02990 [Elusimicrobia bacterium RIFOXYA12_FULL_57_11]OGS13793.1 MAG: hypothetical protein A2234_05655 [Elusimicrobia bacterium RIFOXYA2_FULL_58_8]
MANPRSKAARVLSGSGTVFSPNPRCPITSGKAEGAKDGFAAGNTIFPGAGSICFIKNNSSGPASGPKDSQSKPEHISLSITLPGDKSPAPAAAGIVTAALEEFSTRSLTSRSWLKLSTASAADSPGSKNDTQAPASNNNRIRNLLSIYL